MNPRLSIRLALLLALVLSAAACGPDAATVLANQRAAYEEAKPFAQKLVLAPDTVTFLPFNPADVAVHGDEYTVHGEMEVSSGGRQFRKRFHSTLRQNADSHRWVDVETVDEGNL